jgi:adenylate cyclase
VKYTDPGAVCYFIQERDAGYLGHALSCALDLREAMEKLDERWNLRKGWRLRLCLNMGVSEGIAYCGYHNVSTVSPFMAFGDSINHAGHLAAFSRDGAIWTTKSLLNQLSTEERKSFRFGIRKNGLTEENIFSTVADITPPEGPLGGKFIEITMLPITEIFARLF